MLVPTICICKLNDVPTIEFQTLAKVCFNYYHLLVLFFKLMLLFIDVPAEHILKCCHPSTQYVGKENSQLFGQRLSIVVPLHPSAVDEDGCASESVMLEFLCQNSCTTGINRKSTAVVFTLENEWYVLLRTGGVISTYKRDVVLLVSCMLLVFEVDEVVWLY